MVRSIKTESKTEGGCYVFTSNDKWSYLVKAVDEIDTVEVYELSSSPKDYEYLFSFHSCEFAYMCESQDIESIANLLTVLEEKLTSGYTFID